MARINSLSNFLTDVAAAIKSKKGSDVDIPAANFDTEITNLPSGGTYQTKSITISSNGTQTVTPDTGYDAIEELSITTQVPEKQLQTKTYTFTENQNVELLPDTGYDGFDSVVLTINVAGGEVNNQDKIITENGTYTADVGYTGIGTATVSVPQPSPLNLTVPASVNVDKFTSLYNIPLFTVPQGFDGDIVCTAYGKYSAEDDWVEGAGLQRTGSY